MANPNPNKSGLQPPFSSTNQPKNRGRKPSSLKKYIKDNNLTATDIARLAKNIFPLTEAQIKSMITDVKAPIIMRLFARSIMKDMKNGNLDNVMRLADRAVGRPKETKELTGPEGGPIQYEQKLDYSKLSDTELDQMSAIMEKLAGNDGDKTEEH